MSEEKKPQQNNFWDLEQIMFALDIAHSDKSNEFSRGVNARMLTAFMDFVLEGKETDYYNMPRSYEEINKMTNFHPNVRMLMSQIAYAREHMNENGAKEFLQTMRNIILPTFLLFEAPDKITEESINKMKLFLTRVTKLKSPDLQLSLLNHLFNIHPQRYYTSVPTEKGLNQIQQSVAMIILNHPNASARLRLNVINNDVFKNLATPENAPKILNDIMSTVDNEIQTEMSNTAPNTEVLSDLTRIPYYSLSRLSEQIPERRDIERAINDKYDIDKILGFDSDVEYIAQYDESTNLKNVELQRQLENMQQQLEQAKREKEQLHRQIDQLTQQLQTQRDGNQTLEQRMTQMQIQIREIQTERQTDARKLQQLIDGARRIQSGLGSRGVNKFKQMVENMDR